MGLVTFKFSLTHRVQGASELVSRMLDVKCLSHVDASGRMESDLHMRWSPLMLSLSGQSNGMTVKGEGKHQGPALAVNLVNKGRNILSRQKQRMFCSGF